jgi:hypothetical protein
MSALEVIALAFVVAIAAIAAGTAILERQQARLRRTIEGVLDERRQ